MSPCFALSSSNVTPQAHPGSLGISSVSPKTASTELSMTELRKHSAVTEQGTAAVYVTEPHIHISLT